MKNQKVIIICGFPGVGKTTLAKELSDRLNITCLHKDTIKESLYENLRGKTLEDSMRYGKASAGILLKIADEQIEEGRSLIIESPFEYPEDYHIFQKWYEMESVSLYTVICHVDEEIRQKRYEERTQSRHQAHHDKERTPGSKRINPFKQIPGRKIHINTEDNFQENLEEVIAIIQEVK